jgi:hypothetical protein
MLTKIHNNNSTMKDMQIPCITTSEHPSDLIAVHKYHNEMVMQAVVEAVWPASSEWNALGAQRYCYLDLTWPLLLFADLALALDTRQTSNLGGQYKTLLSKAVEDHAINKCEQQC